MVYKFITANGRHFEMIDLPESENVTDPAACEDGSLFGQGQVTVADRIVTDFMKYHPDVMLECVRLLKPSA